MWLLGIKLRPSRLNGKRLFDPIISPEHHACASTLGLRVNEARSVLCGESQGEKQQVALQTQCSLCEKSWGEG